VSSVTWRTWGHHARTVPWDIVPVTHPAHPGGIDEREAIGVLTGAVAKEQIRDRIEAAGTDRTARAVVGREGRTRSDMRAVGSGLAAMLRAIGRHRPETADGRARTAPA
jgi:hypothetical protein